MSLAIALAGGGECLDRRTAPAHQRDEMIDAGQQILSIRAPHVADHLPQVAL